MKYFVVCQFADCPTPLVLFWPSQEEAQKSALKFVRTNSNRLRATCYMNDGSGIAVEGANFECVKRD